MNKNEIYKRFNKSGLLRSYKNPERDLEFEIANFGINTKPQKQMGFSWDITQKSIIAYDKEFGQWCETKLSRYTLI